MRPSFRISAARCCTPTDTHLIFWEPAGSGLTYDAGYQSLIERFLSDVAADSRMPTNIYGLSGQYRDSVGPAAYDST